MKKNFKLSGRVLFQLSALILTTGLAVLHQFWGIEKVAPIDAYCPFGAVESFFTLLFKGEFLLRIFNSSFILLAIIFISTLILGRVFCSYLCPLGALQEWLRFLGKKIIRQKDLYQNAYKTSFFAFGITNIVFLFEKIKTKFLFNNFYSKLLKQVSIEIPFKYDKYLRYTKYVILLIIMYFSFYLNDLVFRNYDPYTALMHFGYEFDEKIIAYLILFFILISSLLAKTWWCRYFCPLGAFLGIIKKLGFLQIYRNQKTCIKCDLCNMACPANLPVDNNEITKSADCISCNECIDICPKHSLNYTILNGDISRKQFATGVIILLILPIIIVPYTPLWKSKPESNIINVKGEINTADIRGSNTLKYVIDITKVPLTEFQTQLNLPADINLSLKLKEIGTKYNLKNSAGEILETEDFRLVIDNYIKKPNTSIIDTNNTTCPFGEVNCKFPGKCGFYNDQNQNQLCDYSE